ncbi:hypothetical protein QJS04_geneDACA022561 [Acorus gramineus]|uniref:NADH:ubiquinone reductase (non-electrogenic) n=1 Tax=Acorus gramineus TaxID=55184 RepID=A0AAV9A998_ACOGR|nr:hypothetical protein QJS04_geneDACA022561 [Acorus gramineus]
MRFASFIFDGVSQALKRNSMVPKVVVLVAVSGGGLIAYSESQSDHGASIVRSSETEPKKKKLVVLGTGWAGTSFLKNLDGSLYDIQVVSPRNYFAFTPLLPSVTCGTVEARSIVEPIRKIIKKKNGEVRFCEAECFKIDPVNKKVHCQANAGSNLNGTGEFVVDYDYLVIAMGAKANTFNTPGVVEHCHFLKEVEDAQRIRRSVIDSLEKANLPNLSEEEKRKNLQFVIVGGGPTGVEFAAELHDFLTEDVGKIYPNIRDLVRITVVEAGGHILSMFDKRITAFAEQKFQREGIDVKLGYKVTKVSDKAITMVDRANTVTDLPYGMVVWSTGIGTRPVIRSFMEEIGQADRRALATDEWMRVQGLENVYALGDCATIYQRKVMEDISAIFNVADKDNSGTLTVKEIQDVLGDICERYPQVQLYLKSRDMRGLVDLLNDAEGNERKENRELSIEEFKKALAHVDSQVKFLPATAQVAAQQGEYLAKCFNRMKKCEEKPEGPLRIRGTGRHRFRPFSKIIEKMEGGLLIHGLDLSPIPNINNMAHVVVHMIQMS